ncbi:hypothetical protein VOLCADRAFT_101159, partial [Volvox carteri f. nagariensis]
MYGRPCIRRHSPAAEDDDAVATSSIGATDSPFAATAGAATAVPASVPSATGGVPGVLGRLRPRTPRAFLLADLPRAAPAANNKNNKNNNNNNDNSNNSIRNHAAAAALSAGGGGVEPSYTPDSSTPRSGSVGNAQVSYSSAGGAATGGTAAVAAAAGGGGDDLYSFEATGSGRSAMEYQAMTSALPPPSPRRRRHDGDGGDRGLKRASRGLQHTRTITRYGSLAAALAHTGDGSLSAASWLQPPPPVTPPPPSRNSVPQQQRPEQQQMLTQQLSESYGSQYVVSTLQNMYGGSTGLRPQLQAGTWGQERSMPTPTPPTTTTQQQRQAEVLAESGYRVLLQLAAAWSPRAEVAKSPKRFTAGGDGTSSLYGGARVATAAAPSAADRATWALQGGGGSRLND